MTLETESWSEKPNGVHVNQVIVVSKENYKMIILGKGGSRIQEIGQKSRLAMEEAFGYKIHLFLFVKVRKTWQDMPEFYQSMVMKL